MPRESIYKRYRPAVKPGPENREKSYWFIFCNNKLLAGTSGEKASIPCCRGPEEMGLSPVRMQYLGTFQEMPCYSAEITADTVLSGDLSFHDLRSLYSGLDEDLWLLAGRALQIVAWDQTHQYCGRCGQKTEYLPGERAKKCPSCSLISYPRLSPATITAVLREDRILLTHNAAFRGNIHSLIAGFVEPGETLEECVKREVMEEVGIRVKNIRYFGSQPWPFPNSLMIGFTAEYESGDLAADGTEITQANWFEADDLPDLPGKLSIAREIIDWYVENRKQRPG